MLNVSPVSPGKSQSRRFAYRQPSALDALSLVSPFHKTHRQYLPSISGKEGQDNINPRFYVTPHVAILQSWEGHACLLLPELTDIAHQKRSKLPPRRPSIRVRY